ncbi:MAG TPA: NAD(P)/FAD-dependent oxidoreductase, partial [Methylomirabilota bacterium]
ARTVDALGAWSARDAERWPELLAATSDIAAVVALAMSRPAPPLDAPGAEDLWHALQLGRRVRGLGRERLYQLLRWGPMAVADFVAEWCETPVLQAAICARGVLGAAAGPRSAGTTANWMLQAALEGAPAGAPTFTRGGPASLAAALAVAATGAGAEIRLDAEVMAIRVTDQGVAGVVLSSGDEISASLVVSGADPKRTLLDLVDPVRLPPSFRQRIARFRSSGMTAKVNLALDELPVFPALAALGLPAQEALAGRVHIGATVNDLERAFDCAKYGRMSDRPWLEVAFPSLADPALAPPGRHVASIYVQWTPRDLREGDWHAARDRLGDLVVRTLAEHAPDLPAKIRAGEVLTPLDLETKFGLTGGHVFHGEHALDQLYSMRPAPGWAQYRMPVPGLYLCGAGTHPGGGLTGAPGRLAAQAVLKDLKRRNR